MSLGFGFALPAYPLRGGGGNNPFNQLGPTLDLSFAGAVTDLSDPNGYTLNTNFITPEYQVAAQYSVWVAGSGLTQRNFSDIVTFTRASTATYFNSAGTLTTAATNEARFDYDPSTLAARGLLIEEARTNSIRNNTMQGAVAGTPGTLPTNWNTNAPGLTREVVGTGTTAGITWIDVRLSGTTTSTSGSLTFEVSNNIAAANGQNWSESAFVALVAGSLSNISIISLNADQRDSGGAFLSSLTGSDIKGSLTSSLLRYTQTHTTNNASVAFIQPFLRFAWLNASAIDITLRIGLPQLELGAFATSVIPTTTTALTRSADVASVNTLAPWYNAAEGTVYVEVGYQQHNPSSAQHATSFNDTTANNRWTASFAQTSGLGTALRNTSGAGVISTQTANAATVGSTNKIALAISTGASLALNGGTVATNASYAAPTVTQLELGKQLAAGYFNGYLRRITYYPRRLANADLQTITT